MPLPFPQVILGTQYAGEMKKGVFSLMQYVLPKMGILSLHSGCNEGRDGDVTLFFGLSGAAPKPQNSAAWAGLACAAVWGGSCQRCLCRCAWGS